MSPRCPAYVYFWLPVGVCCQCQRAKKCASQIVSAHFLMRTCLLGHDR
jgi:hypothetical protein